MNVASIISSKNRKKLTVLTAYDYATAKILQEAGIDIILVGDSLGTVVMGYPHTIPVTVDEIIHHTKAVRRGAPDSFIVSDLPFGSYGSSVEESVRNAVRIAKLGGANAVKLEGGVEFADIVSSIVKIGLPVMGHIGLKPQSFNKDGYRVTGKTDTDINKLVDDALALESAGVFAVVIEVATEEAAKVITEKVKVPTIGIGAGGFTDGQVLVINDMLGMDKDINLKHNTRYANLHDTILQAVKLYIDEVNDGKFPSDANVFHKK